MKTKQQVPVRVTYREDDDTSDGFIDLKSVWAGNGPLLRRDADGDPYRLGSNDPCGRLALTNWKQRTSGQALQMAHTVRSSAR